MQCERNHGFLKWPFSAVVCFAHKLLPAMDAAAVVAADDDSCDYHTA